MLVIKSASDSKHNFFQVINENGIVECQSEDMNKCKEYVKNNGGIVTLNQLSKSTMDTVAKLNKAVALDCNIALYGEDAAIEMDYQGTLTVWVDAEASHEGDAIYKVYKTSIGFKAILWGVWTSELKVAFTESFEGEKGLVTMLKKIK